MKAKDKYKGQTKNEVKSVDMMYLALRRRKNEFTQLHNHADSVADPRSCRPGDNAGREAVPAEFFAPAFSKVYPALRSEIGEAIRMPVGVAMMTTTTTGVII